MEWGWGSFSLPELQHQVGWEPPGAAPHPCSAHLRRLLMLALICKYQFANH